jgi:nitrogen fixation/metabolism regulation signal transduction histidine kinase
MSSAALHQATLYDHIGPDNIDDSMARTMLKASPNCVKLLDNQGRMMLMSETGLELMEIEDFSSIDGQFWWDLWPKQSHDALRNSFDSAMKDVPSTFEADCPTAKGDWKSWRVHVSKINGGQLDGMILASSKDISQTNTLQQVQDNIVAENKALSRFGHLISHELKNPIRQLSVTAELISEHLENGDKESINGLLTAMRSSSQSLLSLVDNMEAIRRDELEENKSGKLLSILDLLAEACDFVDNFDVRIAGAANFHLLGDARLLTTIFGQILGEFKNQDHRSLSVKVSRLNEEQTHIMFAPFMTCVSETYTSHQSYPAMDLTVMQRVTEGHGGSLDAQHSEDGKLESVAFTFPYADEANLKWVH